MSRCTYSLNVPGEELSVVKPPHSQLFGKEDRSFYLEERKKSIVLLARGDLRWSPFNLGARTKLFTLFQIAKTWEETRKRIWCRLMPGLFEKELSYLTVQKFPFTIIVSLFFTRL